VLYEAMAGDDAHPAIAGYDPDVSAELYTTNGDTDFDFQQRYGTLGFTPEMSTCATASAVDPDDGFDPADCASDFEFPDSEALVQGEFERNLPFALSVAKSAKDPDDPVSAVGRTPPEFRVDSFDVSYGDPQQVAVVAKRAIKLVTMQYRINNGFPRIAAAPEWKGGERYGNQVNDYYAERRGVVRGTRAGDRVQVWFSGLDLQHGFVQSQKFTYTVQRDSGADVLVLANEDRNGVNPEPVPPGGGPKYAALHVAAVQAAGHRADVWNVDTQGVPHDLGVLSHYKAIVWETGDNRITQDPEDALIDTPFGELPDIGVAERQQYLTMAVRDFLNEGGKLISDGELAQYEGLPGISDVVGGLYYGLNGDPSAECHVDSLPGLFSDCLILADDFRQYYLGAFVRASIANPQSVVGTAAPITGLRGDLGGPVVEGDNPLDEAGFFQPTSDVLPPSEFPQFASTGSSVYEAGGSNPFAPIEGSRYAGAAHADASYMRLTKTIDLTGKTNAQLNFQLSLNAEQGYDHFIVEAHTVGQDDWTTLPETGGRSSTTPPSECVAGGFLLTMHPFLDHYIGGPDCTAPGTSGTWNSITGSTDGWQQVSYDLTPFAGRPVEVSLSYVTDPSTGGVGAFVDDTRVVADGVTDADGFEAATSSWTVGDAPQGSPPPAGNWVIGPALLNFFASTSTKDTLLLGFGLEQLSSDAARNALMTKALKGLIG
jgi:hypothetical protein